MNDASAVRTVWQGAMILGEGTLYSMRENALYWVGIKRPAVYRLDLAQGSVDAIPMPDYVGWLVARAGGGFEASMGSAIGTTAFRVLDLWSASQLAAGMTRHRPRAAVYAGAKRRSFESAIFPQVILND